MSATIEPIPFGGATLGQYRHVCAFFSSPREEYDTLTPFVRDGLARGERAYHVLDPKYRDEHLEELRSAGIDIDEAQRTRQLEVASPQDTYLRGGRFNKDAMLALIQEALQTGITLGFPLTRMIAHAESVLQDWASSNEWVEYEMRLNDVLPRYNDPVICTYDANLLDANIALDIIRTHPVVVVGGHMHENPFFERPAQFLSEVRSRNAARTSYRH